jgi:3',5'-nucleoside bisphosphate phosphatase
MNSRVLSTDLIDLHTHSTANDGRWTAATLATGAAAAGLRVVALTDHDTVAGTQAFASTARSAGLIAVPGVEVSSWWHDAVHHVLLYGVDVTEPALLAVLEDVRAQAAAAAGRARDRLRARGYALAGLETIAAGREPLPYDVLLAALHSGLGKTFAEVVQYVVEGLGISFAAAADAADVVRASHRAGGIAVLAHPGRAEFGFATASGDDVREMAAQVGLDGLEVYHWSHGPAEELLYGSLARELGLLVSSGSDSHGPNSSHPLRGREVRHCRALLERCGIAVVDAASGELVGGSEG